MSKMVDSVSESLAQAIRQHPTPFIIVAGLLLVLMAGVVNKTASNNTPSIVAGTTIVPVEDAKIDSSAATINGVVRMVQGAGYRCDSISALHPLLMHAGFSVFCNEYRYHYSVADMGGNWVVSVE